MVSQNPTHSVVIPRAFPESTAFWVASPWRGRSVRQVTSFSELLQV